MKSSVILSILLVCILPTVVLLTVKNDSDTDLSNTMDSSEAVLTDDIETVWVTLQTEKGTLRMELEEYLCCVVLAEMPADFEMEALKAQAVVARTYACRKIADSKHDSANVCTDSACCQAFVSVADYLSAGGTNKSVERVKSAVLDTSGEVLLYDGNLIEATYFSCSGGKTEDAQAVWGTDVPYLQSVDSPGEEKAIHFADSVVFSVTNFCDMLDLDESDLYDYGIGNIAYTDGGGVSSVEIGGISFSGTHVRKKLSLRSTAFVISWIGESVMITTKGFGHRVGMSQYGAEAMAVKGIGYQEILAHYYQGTTLSNGVG